MLMEAFNMKVLAKIGDNMKPEDSYFKGQLPDPPEDLFEGLMEEDEVIMNNEKVSAPDIDTFINEFVPGGDEYDEYVGNMIIMEIGDKRLKCVVKNGSHDLEGNPLVVVKMTTLYLTLDDILCNYMMVLLKTIRPMWLLRTCIHQ